MSSRLCLRPTARSALSLASHQKVNLPAASALLPLMAIRRASFQSMTPSEAQDLLVKQRGNRPVSPHLTIYKPQLTWMLSGLHRITGVALSAGVYALGLSYVVAPILGTSITSTAIVGAVASLPVAITFLTKTAFGGLFSFHVFNGLRHLMWDTAPAAQLNNPAVIKTSLAVLGLTAISTVGLLFL
ncbi:succinate dehydrogenase/Fumarate reductase transmembrane subunit-domain-containing protein [Lipomyces oligophaga]|uniref:succinate dehydrogenase/Fumarate reductase transmembrane subunit-domain-containing protein n=1 Tax=Lipomyces oligophaga TaxID=45792 RepID=UPI0034CF7E9E